MTIARWKPRDDHYYWLTAVLTGRGLQVNTCRVIAGILAGLGVVPAVSAISPFGPHDPVGRALVVGVSVCCLAMSFLWLRHRWPSRGESAMCVAIGTGCIAVACLVATQPVAGLLGTTAFAVLAAYIAVFHSLRLLAFTWTVAAVTLGVLAVRLAALDTALAVSSVFLVVLVNVFAAFACRLGVRLVSGGDEATSALDPSTGLLDRAAFYEGTATLLAARHRDDDRFLVLVVITIDGFSLVTSMSGERGGNQARVAVARALRASVRHNAVLAHVSDAEFVIADTFTAADASPLVDRVRAAVANTPSRLTTSVGVVSTPLGPLAGLPPDDVVDEVMMIARAAMHEARKAGGNRARFVLNPDLTVVENQRGWD